MDGFFHGQLGCRRGGKRTQAAELTDRSPTAHRDRLGGDRSPHVACGVCYLDPQIDAGRHAAIGIPEVAACGLKPVGDGGPWTSGIWRKLESAATGFEQRIVGGVADCYRLTSRG